MPEGVGAGRWEEIEPLIRELEGRRVESTAALERWILDASEL